MDNITLDEFELDIIAECILTQQNTNHRALEMCGYNETIYRAVEEEDKKLKSLLKKITERNKK